MRVRGAGSISGDCSNTRTGTPARASRYAVKRPAAEPPTTATGCLPERTGSAFDERSGADKISLFRRNLPRGRLCCLRLGPRLHGREPACEMRRQKPPFQHSQAREAMSITYLFDSARELQGAVVGEFEVRRGAAFCLGCCFEMGGEPRQRKGRGEILRCAANAPLRMTNKSKGAGGWKKIANHGVAVNCSSR